MYISYCYLSKHQPTIASLLDKTLCCLILRSPVCGKAITSKYMKSMRQRYSIRDFTIKLVVEHNLISDGYFKLLPLLS